MLPLIVVAGVGLMGLVWFVANFNRFTRLRQHIRESWSGIDVELKRRYDLIPNLVETVKGYAAHERSVLEEVVKLRNRAVASTGPAAEQAADESALALGMKRLFAVVENYPQLKSDSQFRTLLLELANTEDRLAAARRFYNGNVRELNQMCDAFPTNMLASMFGFERATYFELSSDAERVVPRVDGLAPSPSGRGPG
jgi:LemA protein